MSTMRTRGTYIHVRFHYLKSQFVQRFQKTGPGVQVNISTAVYAAYTHLGRNIAFMITPGDTPSSSHPLPVSSPEPEPFGGYVYSCSSSYPDPPAVPAEPPP